MKGIRIELSKLWRRNVLKIMHVMHFTQVDLGIKCNHTRQAISNMLNRDDYHLTGIQFLGTIHALKEMIEESNRDNRNKLLASEYLEEIQQEYLKKGLR